MALIGLTYDQKVQISKVENWRHVEQLPNSVKQFSSLVVDIEDILWWD